MRVCPELLPIRTVNTQSHLVFASMASPISKHQTSRLKLPCSCPCRIIIRRRYHALECRHRPCRASRVWGRGRRSRRGTRSGCLRGIWAIDAASTAERSPHTLRNLSGRATNTAVEGGLSGGTRISGGTRFRAGSISAW